MMASPKYQSYFGLDQAEKVPIRSGQDAASWSAITGQSERGVGDACKPAGTAPFATAACMM